MRIMVPTPLPEPYNPPEDWCRHHGERATSLRVVVRTNGETPGTLFKKLFFVIYGTKAL